MRRRCWFGGTSIWTSVLRTGRRKCDRQCTVCTDAMGGWGWWACLVQEEHSHIDLPQHVGVGFKPRRVAASVWAPPCGESCLLPCRYTEDLLHEEWWQKVWMCRRRRIMEKGRWVSDGYILGRGFVATPSLSTASVLLPVTNVINTFVSF